MRVCVRKCGKRKIFFFHFQQREADFSRKIIDIQQLRVTPEYFMVGYYGKGFPLFLSVSFFCFFLFLIFNFFNILVTLIFCSYIHTCIRYFFHAIIPYYLKFNPLNIEQDFHSSRSGVREAWYVHQVADR